MWDYDNSHSRVVAWLKILLPLMALGILSTMFLISRTVDPSTTIPFSEVDPAELARDQRISRPNFSGVTKDGSSIALSAGSARPDATDPSVVVADDLKAVIETAGGTSIDIIARSGNINTRDQTASLAGGVRLVTSTGYDIGTDHIQTRLDLTEISTDGKLVATGPFGQIEAGSMLLTHREDATASDGYVLVFKNGVRLVYEPPK